MESFRQDAATRFTARRGRRPCVGSVAGDCGGGVMSNPKKAWPPEMVEACRKTIAAYDRGIKTNNWSGWGRYGRFTSCRMCITVGRNAGFKRDTCTSCAISGNKANGCQGKTLDNLCFALRNPQCGKVIGAAKRRRTFLVDRMRRAGIEIEGVTR